MATMPQVESVVRTKDELAAELHAIFEGHFDDLGLTPSERDDEYAAMKASVSELNARPSTR